MFEKRHSDGHSRDPVDLAVWSVNVGVAFRLSHH